MLEIPSYYQRDYYICKLLVAEGKISEENAKKLNHIICTLFLGYFKFVQEHGISQEEIPGRDAMEVFEEAMNNIMPVLEVKAKRIGGATYQVPIEVRPERRQTLALRWITLYSRKRGEKTQKDRLANEIMDAANNTGASVKKKEDMHKMAEANKAFSHFRF